MPKLRHPLTPKVCETICAYVRAGAFPHVAAEAAGVPREVFESWLVRGAGKKPKRAYRLFARALRTAAAQARLAAELKALAKHPLDWLRSGPGKERAGIAGWTVPVKPTVTLDNGSINVLLHPELVGLFGAVLEVLAPYPEARTAVAAALASKDQTVPHP
jgi:hypothetical protein